tara:strand:+ start:331 stop:738 length:408 start_codon:yes stop_codon:yes gene_type:complete
MTRFVFSFLLLIYSCQIFDSNDINVISDAQLTEILDADYTLIDVRTNEECKSGYIKDAINFDFYSESFQKEILSLDKSLSIILYCRTQNRSTKTANFLKENGYKNITVLEGGITSWVKNGNDLAHDFSQIKPKEE